MIVLSQIVQNLMVNERTVVDMIPLNEHMKLLVIVMMQVEPRKLGQLEREKIYNTKIPNRIDWGFF